MPAWLTFLNNIEFGISTVYWVCLLLGAALAIVSLIFGEVLDFAFDTDGGPFSGPVISSFVVVFGGAGLICYEVLKMGGGLSTIAALIVSFMSSTVVYFVFAKLILASEGGTTYDPSSIGGTEAEVIIGIPASGIGEIAFDHSSGRISGGARSADGSEIARGSLVRIDKHVGGTYIVAPVRTAEERKSNAAT